MLLMPCLRIFFFFNDTATTEIYTLSLHDALPIFAPPTSPAPMMATNDIARSFYASDRREARRRKMCEYFRMPSRSEEHTSELQSRSDLVCRLLLEKKKKDNPPQRTPCYDLP